MCTEGFWHHLAVIHDSSAKITISCGTSAIILDTTKTFLSASLSFGFCVTHCLIMLVNAFSKYVRLTLITHKVVYFYRLFQVLISGYGVCLFSVTLELSSTDLVV